MIQWGLIKNNMKLMLRSKWILFFMIVLPLVVMSVLASVFEDFLGKDYSIDRIDAGYVVEGPTDEGWQDIFASSWQAFVNGCEENNIYLKEYKGDDYRTYLENGETELFAVFGEGEIRIYRTNERELEAMVLGSMLSAFGQGFYGNMVLMEQVMEHPDTMKPVEEAAASEEMFVMARQVDVDPVPPSMDYYGIIEIVYFAWCGMVSLAVVISSERKNKIESRLQITPASGLSLYLGKMIPCFLATGVELCVTVTLSVLLFDVHWGRMWASAGILLLLCLTVSAVGVFLFYLFRNVVASIVTGYLGIMVMGYLGGSFATYMYGVPESQARWSVQYFVNRTLVEFSTKGESDYMTGCVLFLSGITLVCVLLGMLLMRKRMEA